MEVLNSESAYYKKNPVLWNILLIIMISLSFILSDWSILYSSFGDFILALTLALMLVLKVAIIGKKQILLMLIPFVIVLITSTYSYFFYNHWFEVDRLVLSSAKIGLYMTTLIIFYNHIIFKNLKWQFLKISNVIAVLMVLLSIVIMFLIYYGHSEIYNTIWTFTRTDELSYTYGSNLIRARGLFSEPAHLGYYLNTLFFANIFSSFKKQKFVLIILTIGIILTFSYSMIAIYASTGSIYILKVLIKGKFKWSPLYLLVFVVISGLFFMLKDYLNEAIVQRTINIIQGADGSAYNRIFESWMWVDRERLLFGNLIGHTPPITNIFAYFLSDFGLFGLIPYLIFTVFVAFNNFAGFIFFVGMNVAKGGYLNPAFSLMLLYLIMFFLKRTAYEKDYNRLNKRIS